MCEVSSTVHMLPPPIRGMLISSGTKARAAAEAQRKQMRAISVPQPGLSGVGQLWLFRRKFVHSSS